MIFNIKNLMLAILISGNHENPSHSIQQIGFLSIFNQVQKMKFEPEFKFRQVDPVDFKCASRISHGRHLALMTKH